MMKIRNKKSSRTVKRALAFAMSFALAMSTFAVSPSADAASKKAPKLSVKKKTLYYNQAGKKTYTLKVKKNKVKAIKKTTWKTSKKSVVAISSKKKTSVKLTAKKAGTAKITATVKYTVKGSKKVQTKKLTCTVSSKKAAAVTPTATATAAATATATAGATATATANATATATAPAEPTATAPTEPTAVPVASAITLDKAEATIGTAAGKNTVTLTATVKDAAGNAMTDQAITWTSDKAEVATVDEKGVVTAVADGQATITAALGALSATCKVTVDGVVPTIEKAEVTDYKTITATLSEEVTGTPDVKVYLNAGTAAMKTTEAALAADGKSIVITNSEALKVATYKVVINGLTDKVGNAMAKDTSAEAEKETSTIKEFVPSAKEAPAPNAKKSDGSTYTATRTDVYYTVVDQYGEAMDVIDVPATSKLTATAKINGSDYPLDAKVNNNFDKEKIKNKSRIEIEADTAMVAGKVIDITVKNRVSATVEYTSTFSVTLIKPDGVGAAAKFESVTVGGTKMKNEGTEIAPVYTLNAEGTSNLFTITSKMLDKYAYPATNGKIKYVSSNTKVLSFDSDEEVATSSNVEYSKAVDVYALGKGEATITAYLQNDDTVSFKIPVKINPVQLESIKVASAKSKQDQGGDAELPTNGVNNYYAITLNDGKVDTGLKATDLKAKVISGDATVTLYEGIGTTANPDKNYDTKEGVIYANVVPAADGKEKEITYLVYTGTYDEATKRVKDGKSCTVTVKTKPSTYVSDIKVTAFGENAVTAEESHDTELKVLNAQGEDITSAVNLKDIEIAISAKKVVEDAKARYDSINKKGLLTVTAGTEELAKGQSSLVTLVMDKAATSLTVNVVAKAAVAKMTFTGDGEVVKNDTLAYEYGVDTDRVAVGETIYKVVPVKFTNQFGDKMKVSSGELNTYAAAKKSDLTKANITIVGLYQNADGSYSLADEEVSALGITAGNGTDPTADDEAVYATFTNGIAEGTDGYKKIGSFGITPLAQRVITTFKDSTGDVATYTATTGAVIAGKSIVALDQYGRKLPIGYGDEYINSSDKSKVEISTTDWNKTYSLTVKATEDANVKIIYNGKFKGAYTGDKAKSFDVSVKVIDASKVDKFTINNSINSSESNAGHDSSKYLVQLGGMSTDLTLGVSASAAGTAVDVDPAKALDWEIASSDLKIVGGDKAGKAANCTVTMVDNVVTVANPEKQTVSGSITVRAKSKNGKATAEYKFNVSNETATPQADTYYLSKEAKANDAQWKKITAYSWSDADSLGEFYVYGVSQYGINMPATVGIKSVTSMDTDKLEVKWLKGYTNYADNAVYCKAIEVGTTDVVINFTGASKSITVPVTATKKSEKDFANPTTKEPAPALGANGELPLKYSGIKGAGAEGWGATKLEEDAIKFRAGAKMLAVDFGEYITDANINLTAYSGINVYYTLKKSDGTNATSEPAGWVNFSLADSSRLTGWDHTFKKGQFGESKLSGIASAEFLGLNDDAIQSIAGVNIQLENMDADAYYVITKIQLIPQDTEDTGDTTEATE